MSDDAVMQEDLQNESRRECRTLLCDARHGDVVAVHGFITDMSLYPVDRKEPKPRFQITVTDGTENVIVVFLGRRQIPGVIPGRKINLTGRIILNRQHPMMFNPRYALLPFEDDSNS